jgi:ABC-type phosphate/phosphonate transport system substrate-binding protein
MAGISSLAMYDWPQLRPAQDAFYAALQLAMSARGLSPPRQLSWNLPLSEVWASDDLYLAQTCGYPFAAGHCGDAQLVATPCYDVPECDGSSYRSMLVAAGHRRGDELSSFRDGVVAINDAHSYSGQRALFRHLDSLSLPSSSRPGQADSFFSAAHATGSHLASMQAVAAGEADLAAIDCVLWAHAAEFLSELNTSLCIIGRTKLAPGLPFITSGSRSAEEVALMQAALTEVLGGPDQDKWRALRLRAVEILPPTAYDQA